MKALNPALRLHLLTLHKSNMAGMVSRRSKCFYRVLGFGDPPRLLGCFESIDDAVEFLKSVDGGGYIVGPRGDLLVVKSGGYLVPMIGDSDGL